MNGHDVVGGPGAPRHKLETIQCTWHKREGTVNCL